MVRRILSLWPRSWPLVKHLAVVLVAEIYAIIACSAPLYAFQISSTTGYSRVVSQAAQQAYIAANRGQVINAIAQGVTAAGAGSVAIRAVTGPIGWAAIGVSAALVIAAMLYDQATISALTLVSTVVLAVSTGKTCANADTACRYRLRTATANPAVHFFILLTSFHPLDFSPGSVHEREKGS